MRQSERTLPRPRIVPTAGQRVKGRIYSAGLGLENLARSAGIAPSTLSRYLGGDLRSRSTQHDIWFAFRAMTGVEISMADFWGSLLSTEVAA